MPPRPRQLPRRRLEGASVIRKGDEKIREYSRTKVVATRIPEVGPYHFAFVRVCASESPPGGHRNGKATCRHPVTMCRVPCSLYTDSYTVIRGMFKRVTARLFAFWSLRSLAPARTGARARRGGRGASGGGESGSLRDSYMYGELIRWICMPWPVLLVH